MPRLTPSANEMMDREYRAAYKAGLELKGLTPASIAKLLGTCEKTVKRRKDKPGDLKLFELRAIAEKLNFTPEQVVRMILK